MGHPIVYPLMGASHYVAKAKHIDPLKELETLASWLTLTPSQMPKIHIPIGNPEEGQSPARGANSSANRGRQ